MKVYDESLYSRMNNLQSTIRWRDRPVRLGTDHYFSGGEGGGGGGMKNIEKNCLQGLKRQNKLFANIICIKKIVCIEVRETFF